MCGIVACRRHEPAIAYLLGARRREYRSHDSLTPGGRRTGRLPRATHIRTVDEPRNLAKSAAVG
jgi:hypothetical protein